MNPRYTVFLALPILSILALVPTGDADVAVSAAITATDGLSDASAPSMDTADSRPAQSDKSQRKEQPRNGDVAAPRPFAPSGSRAASGSISDAKRAPLPANVRPQAAADSASNVLPDVGTTGAGDSSRGELAPPNDDCVNAQRISFGSASGTTVGATPDTAPDCDGVGSGTPGVWYAVIGTGNTMVASTCSEFNANPDTKISVYCGGCDVLACAAANDDDCTGQGNQFLSTVSWCSEAGVEYLILVHDYSATSGSGAFTLSVGDGATCDTPPLCAARPPHDDCGDCIPVTTGVPYNGSTVGATGTDIESCTIGDTADVWHCWAADCTGAATFSLCGSTFDTSLAIYNDCGGSELACNDDGCGTTLQSELALHVTSGATYWVRIAGYQGITGDYELKVSCARETGSCCDDATGVCQDGVSAIDCQTPDRFAVNTLCSDLSPPCAAPVGACCVSGQCLGEFDENSCLQQGGIWHQGDDCVVCPRACCLDGTCVEDTDLSTCTERGGAWHPHASCVGNVGLPAPICTQPICGFDNGPPLDDFGAPASQFAPDFPFGAGAADDFVLQSSGNGPCRVTNLRVWTSHFNNQAAVDPNVAYQGVNVTVYADTQAKGPAGQPENDGTHSSLFPGGVVHSVTIPMTAITVTPLDATCILDMWQLDMTVDLLIPAGTKYWLEVQPIMDFTDIGQTAIALSQTSQGHNAQQIFSNAGIVNWTEVFGNNNSCPDNQPPTPPAGTRRDLAFQMSGTEIVFCSQSPFPACNGECPPGAICTGSPTGGACVCRAPSEACCPPNGECADVPPDDCRASSGIRRGPGTNCKTTPCPQPPQACCFADATCAAVLGGSCTAACPCNPDMNCDGALDASDIDPFNTAMTDPTTYQNQYPSCVLEWADVDCDGDIDELDWHAFHCLLGIGGPTECMTIDAVSCTSHGGTPLGANTACATTQEACCSSTNGACLNGDPVCCAADQGSAQGPGTACGELAAACCLGSECAMVDPLCCDDLGGVPSPIGEPVCLQDNNGDGVDDACESPPTGACCDRATGVCVNDVLEINCVSTQQTWNEGLPCDNPNVACAPPTEACCMPDGTCRDATIPDCLTAGGVPQGQDSTCASDICPIVEIDYFPNTTALMELQLPNGDSVPIALSGPTTVHVFFEGANEGDANDNDGNGMDEVETEMVDMQLTGLSPFGPVQVRLHPDKPSRGEIEETANTLAGRLDLPPFAPEGTANSFFDVFFEIDVGGMTFHTQTAKRMSSVITHKPPAPGNTYENPEKIPLLDENGNSTGYSIGAGRHVPRPPVEVDYFPNTTALMELQLPNGDSVPIALSGPTTVHVFFEGANEGDANDNDGNGMDEVETEMVDMQLTGLSPFGPVQVRLHPDKPSRGRIEETANTQSGRLDLPPFAPSGTASSFFDVFFEIDVGGMTFHTQTAKRMSSVITHKPPAPGNTYENLEKIPLLDENGNSTGYSIGAGRHVPRPQCGSAGTGDCFEPHDTPFCDQGECCERVCSVAPNCCETGWSTLCAELAQQLCAAPQACCLPDGRCKDLPESVCELGGGRPLGADTACGQTQCERLGDCNSDNRVDLRDFARFQNCFDGGGPTPTGCECADLDGDGDVDLIDVRIFVSNIVGP